MIKTGIYGLLRVADVPRPAAGVVGLAADRRSALISGVLGVLFALAQHDLKRLLAYHSVENIGIIALGLGVGLLGLALRHRRRWPCSASPAALLHVLNHALFKGLLFLGAGAVLHAHRHARDRPPRRAAQAHAVDRRAVPGRRGGHLRAAAAQRLRQRVPDLPRRASAALSRRRPAAPVAGGSRPSPALALIGGLAAACFAKAFGIVFLGEPRSDHAARRARSGPRRCGCRWSLLAAALRRDRPARRRGCWRARRRARAADAACRRRRRSRRSRRCGRAAGHGLGAAAVLLALARCSLAAAPALLRRPAASTEAAHLGLRLRRARRRACSTRPRPSRSRSRDSSGWSCGTRAASSRARRASSRRERRSPRETPDVFRERALPARRSPASGAAARQLRLAAARPGAALRALHRC